MAEKYWPEKNTRVQQNILKRVRKTNASATLDDARDLYVTHMMLQTKQSKKIKDQSDFTKVKEKSKKR